MSFQNAKAGKLCFQLHLPLDFRVRRRDRLDLGITQCRFVDVLRFAYRKAAVLDLAYKPLLVFEYLITVTVQRPFRDIGKNLDGLVHVVLTDTPAVPLL